MFTRFEEYAASSMLGQPDSPPRQQGKVWFGEGWQREVFGLALTLSKAGHFEWEDFRSNLVTAIADWEKASSDGRSRWVYYECFLLALMQTIADTGVLASVDLAAIGLRAHVATL